MVRTDFINYGEKVKLDEKDKKILELLHKNARMSNSEISRKTGIQRDSVAYRITRMEKLKVIRFYSAVMNPSILGYPIYSYVDFELQNFDNDTEKQFVAYLSAHSNITYIAKLSGKWDYEIVITAKNIQEFDDILREIRKRFSQIIKNYNSSTIIQEYKFDYLVDLVGKD